MAEGITARLVEIGRSVEASSLPEEVLEVARHCVLDWLGCTIAAVDEPLVRILRDEIVAGEAGQGATLVASGGTTSVLTAALVNGAASHALDFDDTHRILSGHPSVPVLPAIAALAERDRRSGADLLAALVAGIEVECRLGALLGAPHYDIGWHATATLGTFGAAAAASHLLGLEEVAWRHAFGLAGTQAAGLKSGFGTMAKPLHAGKAAQGGLLAALLARGGFTANPDVVETTQGFAAVLAGTAEPDRARLDRWDGRFMISDTLFKYHAACYLTHAPINALVEIRDGLGAGFVAEDVEAVDIRIDPPALKVCNIAEPTTGLEGKFSLRATAAMALLGRDTAALDSFTDAVVTAPEVVALRDRVDVRGDASVSFMRAEVTVRLRGGETRIVLSDSSVPAADLGRQREALERKFVGLVRPVLGERRTAELLGQVSRIGELDDVGSLWRATVR